MIACVAFAAFFVVKQYGAITAEAQVSPSLHPVPVNISLIPELQAGTDSGFSTPHAAWPPSLSHTSSWSQQPQLLNRAASHMQLSSISCCRQTQHSRRNRMLQQPLHNACSLACAGDELLLHEGLLSRQRQQTALIAAR